VECDRAGNELTLSRHVLQQEVHREVTRPKQGVPEFLRGLLARIIARSENFVAGRYWIWETFFLTVLFTILFSAGVDERFTVATGPYDAAYFQKIEHPLLDVAKIYSPDEHGYSINFRLTIPVILHVLHAPTHECMLFPALEACGTCALILFSCLYAFRVTGDRVCALYTALGVSCTYIGSFAFTMYYDSIAICQLALAMLPGMPSLARGFLVFTASFTDERAWFASFLLLAQPLCMPADNSRSLRERVLSGSFLSVCGGMAAYVIGRLALIRFAGLTPTRGGNGFGMLLHNAPFWHAGILLALKGGWLLVGVAAICLWQRRRFAGLTIMATFTCMSIGGGLMVGDVLKSTSYVFPALLVALGVAAECENLRRVRIYCLMAFVISALAGNYNVWLNQITWFQPLAVKGLNHLLHAIFGTPLPGA
jgi:hypothetical protein